MHRTFLLALVMLLLVQHFSLAQPERSKTATYVKVRVTTEKPDATGEQKLKVFLDIDEKYYLIGAEVAEDLKSSRLRIEVLTNGKPAKAEFSYPCGKREKDAVLGDYQIYRGQVIVPGWVRRAPEDAGQLELVIRMQGYPISTIY